jgi:hypothetical protein
METLRKRKKFLSRDNRCPGRDSIQSPSEYEAEVLLSQSWRSVKLLLFECEKSITRKFKYMHREWLHHVECIDVSLNFHTHTILTNFKEQSTAWEPNRVSEG